jgi:hypothetical protein
MSLGIEIDDRLCAIARDGTVLDAAPGVASQGDGSGSSAAPLTGVAALARIRLQPTLVSTRHWAEIAREALPSSQALSLAGADLGALIAAAGAAPSGDAPSPEALWIAVPARFGARALGSVLALTRGIGLSVAGFVDSAAASVAALDVSRTALVLDLGLHHLSVTAVETEAREAGAAAHAGGTVRRRRAVVVERGGLLELYDAWLDLVRAAMVKRTRFDPLREAASEQQLFDSLPRLAAEAAASGSATALVETRGERFEVTLGREQYAEVAERVYREIIRAFHELRPAGARVALLVPQIVPALPGLAERLQQFAGCELIVLPQGFAAAAASRFEAPLPAGEAVKWLRRVPRLGAIEAGAGVRREMLGGGRERAAPASHVLYGGHAYPLAAQPLSVGRAPSEAPSATRIVLPEGLAAVSRSHCTLLREADAVVLVDHSRYGTFVNGERVAGRTVLRAGDTIRIGEPGVELALISVAPGTQSPGASV